MSHYHTRHGQNLGKMLIMGNDHPFIGIYLYIYTHTAKIPTMGMDDYKPYTVYDP